MLKYQYQFHPSCCIVLYLCCDLICSTSSSNVLVYYLKILKILINTWEQSEAYFLCTRVAPGTKWYRTSKAFPLYQSSCCTWYQLVSYQYGLASVLELLLRLVPTGTVKTQINKTAKSKLETSSVNHSCQQLFSPLQYRLFTYPGSIALCTGISDCAHCVPDLSPVLHPHQLVFQMCHYRVKFFIGRGDYIHHRHWELRVPADISMKALFPGTPHIFPYCRIVASRYHLSQMYYPKNRLREDKLKNTVVDHKMSPNCACR